MTRIPRRRSYRARPRANLTNVSWLLLGLAVGVGITAVVAVASRTVVWSALIINSAVVVASLLGVMALGERVAFLIWQQRGMEELCTKQKQALQCSLDAMGDRLTQRESTIATLTDIVNDQKKAINDLNGTKAAMQYKIDRLEKAHGQGLAEYAIILAAIAAFVLLTLTPIGAWLLRWYSQVGMPFS